MFKYKINQNGEVIIPSEIEGKPVTGIGAWAFGDCRSLTSVTIPDSVTSIESWAFEGCSSLKDVYYEGTAEQWQQIEIMSCNSALNNAKKHFKNA